MVSGFEDTGVFEDEGQHLQDVYPPASHHGGPGRFALDPVAHLTGDSGLVSADARNRLWSSWSPHWDLGKTGAPGKVAAESVRMRFLQAVFPGSRFVVVVRHPVAVAYATKKWTHDSLRSLLSHWAVAHRLALEDAAHIDHVTFLRFEDLLRDPAGELARIFSFIGLTAEPAPKDVQADINRRYLDRWQSSWSNPIARLRAGRLSKPLSRSQGVLATACASPMPSCPPSPKSPAYLGEEAGDESPVAGRRVGAGV